MPGSSLISQRYHSQRYHSQRRDYQRRQNLSARNKRPVYAVYVKYLNSKYSTTDEPSGERHLKRSFVVVRCAERSVAKTVHLNQYGDYTAFPGT